MDTEPKKRRPPRRKQFPRRPKVLPEPAPIVAAELAAGSPALGSPTLTQNHALAAADPATASPVIGTPAASPELTPPFVEPPPAGWMKSGDRDGDQIRAQAASRDRMFEAAQTQPTFVPRPPVAQPPTGWMQSRDDAHYNVAKMYADRQNRYNPAVHGQPSFALPPPPPPEPPEWNDGPRGIPPVAMHELVGASEDIANLPPQNAAEQTTPPPVVHSGAATAHGDGTAAANATVRPKRGRKTPTGRLAITKKKQALQYSNIIIVALQDALDYEPARHHNQPPPALYIDDGSYKDDIRELIGELRRLNDLLERKSLRAAKKPAINLAKHFDTFLGTYSKAMGWGLSGLTIGSIYALLEHIGLGPDIVGDIFRHWKGR